MFDKNIGYEMNSKGDFVPVINIPYNEDEQEKSIELEGELPIIALRNTVLFPRVIIPITMGREKSIAAIEAAKNNDNIIGVLSQRDQKKENPSKDDLYEVGTYAKIIKEIKMPDGSRTTILKGIGKFSLENLQKEVPYLAGEVDNVFDEEVMDQQEFEIIVSTILDKAKMIINLSPHLPKEAMVMLENVENEYFLLDFIASNLNASTQAKQEILEIKNPTKKAKAILEKMLAEIQVLEYKNQIESKVRGDIEKQQRDFFLNQQLKTIQEELGNNPQDEELDKLALRAEKKQWPDEVAKSFDKELKRAKRTNPQVAEYSVLLNYLETMLDLPWGEFTEDNFNLKSVQDTLDADHYGLEDVKKRIIEHLAVLKLKGDMNAPIICLVGPPGVGKTSLGKSIAKALNRKFERISLGGLHDESEIRGHRKTYIGAMPGRIIKSLKKVQSSNPVFILDEIDKINSNFRGDPSSALLEVLDPEQNDTFHDNYIDEDYDLSKVLFIATANSLETIQPALRDRMEIIRIEGYSTEEKINIAKNHLIPKELEAHGLIQDDITLTDNIIEFIISKYTKEAGVRNLSRKIAGVMRAIAKFKSFDEDYNKKIDEADIIEYLGPTVFSNDIYTEQQVPGVAIGLAWTQVGGDILFIESSKSKGSGKLVLTGNLGDVMKESATTALSYIKANAKYLGLDHKAFKEHDVHIHVPQGAIPKDGPSAGVTMLSAIASLFLDQSIKSHLAMTGEITLRGKVLPVGGIKEKILAAKRAGLKEIMLCADNKKHVDLINQDFLGELKFKYVTTMKEVLEHALGISFHE